MVSSSILTVGLGTPILLFESDKSKRDVIDSGLCPTLTLFSVSLQTEVVFVATVTACLPRARVGGGCSGAVTCVQDEREKDTTS